jgi:hypothetical protein
VPTSVDVEWLAGVPLFEGLSSAFLAGLAARVTAERVVKQHVVVRQGEAAERFYIIAEENCSSPRLAPTAVRYPCGP